jgi:uncharacterized protein with LGFP repeats
VYWSSGTGGWLVRGQVRDAYWAAGSVTGPLGFPTSGLLTVVGGTAQAFQGGSVYASSSTGAVPVTGPALSAYWAAGSVTGPLGFPTRAATAVGGNGLVGTRTVFQGGAVYANATTGARVVLAAVESVYGSAGGPSSSYGWPVSDSYAVSGGQRNDFQTGQITA